MPSQQFKNFLLSVKKAGDNVDLPHYIGVDKVSGEIKQTPKNLRAYELVKSFDTLPDNEKSALATWRVTPLRNELHDYAKTILKNPFTATSSIPDLWRTLRSKLGDIEKRKEREAKKAATAAKKQSLVNSLNRKDVANTVSGILKSMEPYISKAEVEIKQNFEKQDKEFTKDWNDTLKKMEQTGVFFVGHNRGKTPHEAIFWNRVSVEGIEMRFNHYIVQSGVPIRKWLNSRGWEMTQSGAWIAKGEVNGLIKQTQKLFRISQESKVNTLFFRLFNSNPTLSNYELSSPYNGKEFSLNAINEKGERIVIQTTTILAGGYNIQRLHTRWLVNVRNSITGKAEKFTITDKDTK